MPKKVTSKSNKQQPNQKFIIIAIALGLAALGYVGYRSMLTKPDINKVDTGEKPRRGGSSNKDARNIKLPKNDPNVSRERIRYESAPTQ